MHNIGIDDILNMICLLQTQTMKKHWISLITTKHEKLKSEVKNTFHGYTEAQMVVN